MFNTDPSACKINWLELGNHRRNLGNHRRNSAADGSIKKCFRQISSTGVCYIIVSIFSSRVMQYVLNTPHPLQGQLLKGAECHIYLYCFKLVYIDLNRAFVIIV